MKFKWPITFPRAALNLLTFSANHNNSMVFRLGAKEKRASATLAKGTKRGANVLILLQVSILEYWRRDAWNDSY